MEQRTYLLLYSKTDSRVEALAPLSAMTAQIENIKASQIAAVREVSFNEWLPVFWRHSDYTEPPPDDLTEEAFWNGGYF